MKKFSLIIGVSILLMIVGCSAKSNQNYIAKQINITIPDTLSIEQTDDHGGFHGDGKRFAKIEFDKENSLKVLSQIEKGGRWKKMPLTENLNLIMYGGVKNNIEYGYKLAKEFGIPEIKNGYWCFIDRHFDSTNTESDTEIFDRYSFNFTISMYDIENNTLYYCEFDT